MTLFIRPVQAQEEAPNNKGTKDDKVTERTIHFILGANYQSGLNYFGRTDSLNSSGICPFAGLSFSNGLYLNATCIFLRNSLQSTYAATLLEGGYNFKNKKGNLAGNLAATRYFYQDNTDLIQSVVKESISASLTNLNHILDITIGASVRFSDQADYTVQAGTDHIIRFSGLPGKSILALDPTATLYAGTQNYIRTWFQQKQLLIFPVGEQQQTTINQQFDILAFECSMPILYAYKQLNLLLTPSYILPQHVLTASGGSETSGKGTPLFYFTATLKLTL